MRSFIVLMICPPFLRLDERFNHRGEAAVYRELQFGHLSLGQVEIVVLSAVIAVVVDKLEVAGHSVRLDAVAVLVYICCSFFVGLEDAVCLNQIELVERTTLAALIDVRNATETAFAGPYAGFAVFVLHTDVGNLVLEIREVTADAVRPVAIDAVVPAAEEFKTAVADLAEVNELRRKTDVVGPVDSLLLNEVVGLSCRSSQAKQPDGCGRICIDTISNCSEVSHVRSGLTGVLIPVMLP